MRSPGQVCDIKVFYHPGREDKFNIKASYHSKQGGWGEHFDTWHTKLADVAASIKHIAELLDVPELH